MRKEAVNPDMDLKSGSVANPKPPKKISKSGGRENVNPDMDLKKEGSSPGTNTGGAINTGKREQVNPDMDLTKEGPKGEVMDEQAPATMPGVGKMPTGKKAVKKAMPGMG